MNKNIINWKSLNKQSVEMVDGASYKKIFIINFEK
jgi:hypothetical protein